MEDDEWERLVAGIVGANAALARVVPRAALGADEFDRARFAPAPAPAAHATSLLDEILRDLRAAAALDDDDATQPAAAPATGADDAADGGAPSCGSSGRDGSSSVAAASTAPPAQATCPRPTPDRIAGLDDSPCPVCLSTSSRSQFSVLAPCWHRFCFSCISMWLRVAGPTRARCPTCRGEAAALLYSIRTVDDYKYRLLTHDATALLGNLEPVPPSRSREAPGRPCSVDDADAGSTAPGAAAKRSRQDEDGGSGGGGRRRRSASPPPASSSAAAAAAPPPGATAEAPPLPRALVQQYADGSLGCSVAETDRVRAALGLPPLRQ